MFAATWIGRTVEGESEDNLKCRTLNVIHRIKQSQQTELWNNVSALLIPDGRLDVSSVITKDNLMDVEYLFASGVVSDVTNLNLSFNDVFGDEDDVERICRGLEAMPQLNTLNLETTKLTDAGMGRVCRTVSCDNNALTDVVSDEVAATARDLPGLTIRLKGCRLSREVCDRLDREFNDRIVVIAQQLCLW
ncbi:hypothetical protein LSAT2_000302 [Lamellibrachia satsuma]|nr:hypothetical protein LSAT2_000302 [Lamellibrachia satsuma]